MASVPRPSPRESGNDGRDTRSKDPEDRSPHEHGGAADRSSSRDFGADRYVHELQEMGDRMERWAQDHGWGHKNDEHGSSRWSPTKAAPTQADLSSGNKSEKVNYRIAPEFIDVAYFAMERGFHVTSTTGGTHNTNSLHAKGRAIDVRTWDRSPEDVNTFMRGAQAAGLRVRDERQRPENQKVWSGSHLHLSVDQNHYLSNDRSTHQSDSDASIRTQGQSLLLP